MSKLLKITSISLLLAMMLSLVPPAMVGSAQSGYCYAAQFITDVTVPDGTTYAPNTAFTKTWRLKNIGTCAWNNVTSIFVSGSQMGAPASVPVSNGIQPGQTVDVTVNMVAPSTAGQYIGYWQFKSAEGTIFGIGAYANKAWWVDINVSGGSSFTVVYDFNINAPYATWTSGAGALPFPGTPTDTRGFALIQNSAVFESGITATSPTLLMGPQQVSNGYVQGVYPSFKVQSGDRFKTTVGCQYGATSCYVLYRLDYMEAGVVKTFWSFRERYEGLTYSPSLDLSPLAGKEVNFILYISAYGSPVGDQALWGNPVITRSGSGTPPPPVTGTPPTPAPITPTIPPSSCDRVQFISDVTVPDGTNMQPGQSFVKTWRLKNVGSCTWTTAYQLVFYSGNQMGAAPSAAFTKTVYPGNTVDVSMNMVAPSSSGSYRGYWMFKNANGALFGIGSQANQPWWVDINVVGGPTVTPGTPVPTTTALPTGTPLVDTAYDFATNACSASWYSGAGALTCPGNTGDAKGYVQKVSNPKLETGVTDPRPGLLTVPQNIQDGYIQGIYPAFKVQSNDRFQSTINCQYGSTSCYVVFRLDYQIGSNPIKTLWGPFLERVDTPPMVYPVDVNLSSLAGQDVKFILTVLAAGAPTGDNALWVGPRIYRPGFTAFSTPTSTTAPTSSNTQVPTATNTTAAPAASATSTTDPTAGWLNYYNEKYAFEFKYPNGSTIINQSDIHTRINLPITAGTNLLEKYLDVSVLISPPTCKSPDIGSTPTSSQNVTINGIQFLKEIASGAAAGNIYDVVAYSTQSGTTCVSMTFVLHSVNPNTMPTPPPAYNKAAESAVFDQIMNTFDWTG